MNAPARPLDLAAKAAALAAMLAVGTWVGRLAPAQGTAAPVLTALGLLLLAGDLLAELMERLKLPHLTGYLIAGLAVGPFGMGLVSEATVQRLSPVNDLALALIALSAGGELSVDLLKRGARSLLAAIGGQVLVALPIIAVGFFVLRGFFPFLQGMGGWAALGVALLWSVLAISRSPAATLGLIAQVKPDGPLTRYALSVVVAFDLVVLILFALVIEIARALIEPGASFSIASLRGVGMEIVGSLAAGTTLGLLVVVYLKLIDRQLILFLLVLAYGMTELARYFGYDSLLLFVMAGFIAANVSRRGGERLLEAVSQGGRVAYVVFFAVAGAHLDLGLLAKVWPLALGLAALRIGASWLAARAGSAIAKDPPEVRRWGWMPLVSQAGVTIGMSVVVANAFASSFGSSLQALVVAVVGVNEMVGPVLFKLALDRTGESGKGMPAVEEEEPAAGVEQEAVD